MKRTTEVMLLLHASLESWVKTHVGYPISNAVVERKHSTGNSNEQ